MTRTVSEAPPALGRRILVWGVSGSGKTTFARRLAQALGVPAVQMDALFWKPGWVETPDDEFLDKVRCALDQSPDGWVIDGSYWRVSSAYLDQTDAVIWLRLPWRICFWRLFVRTVSRAWTREPLYYQGGPRESWRQTFFDRRSILWFSISRHRQGITLREQRVAALPDRIRVYELKSDQEVEAFLRGLDCGG
jgi:adenylate kinase family enzyme